MAALLASSAGDLGIWFFGPFVANRRPFEHATRGAFEARTGPEPVCVKRT
jgi:hypothetical protein